ncbi:PAAR domain-containing protein, partial [Ralstonia pseudosolanacearum]
MRGIIRVGDATSHGGRVESGAPASTVMGRAVARKGDRCSCP